MTAAPYQVFDDLSPEEYEALKTDIAERGVLVPIEMDDEGNILDGHHRLRACQELRITDYPRIVRSGLSEQGKRDHARSLQMLRRHLTSEQKRRVIADQLRETPERSDRAISRLLGVDHKTVAAVRRGEIPHQAEQVSGSDSTSRRLPINSIRAERPLRDDMGDLDALSASIERLGLIQPLVVAEDGLLIAGYRRLAAIQRIRPAWQTVPVHVVALPEDAGEREAALCGMQLAANEWENYTPEEIDRSTIAMTGKEARAAIEDIRRLEAVIDAGLQQLRELRQHPRWQDGTLQQSWRQQDPAIAELIIPVVNGLDRGPQPTEVPV